MTEPVQGQLVIDEEDTYRVKYRTPKGIFEIDVKGVDCFDAGARVKRMFPDATLLASTMEGSLLWQL